MVSCKAGQASIVVGILFSFSHAFGLPAPQRAPPPTSRRTTAPDFTVTTGFFVDEKYPRIAFSGVNFTT